MQARKGPDTRFWAAAIFLLAAGSLQGQTFSAGKNLYDLHRAVFNPSEIEKLFFPVNLPPKLTPATSGQADAPFPGSVFLPRWSAECLPFFCRIEHDFMQKSAVNFKFRLGSVDYVDWLEGKGDAVGYPGQ